MTSDTRRAKEQLKEQIEESLSDLKAPVLTDHDLIQLLKMPKVKIKDKPEWGKDEDSRN